MLSGDHNSWYDGLRDDGEARQVLIRDQQVGRVVTGVGTFNQVSYPFFLGGLIIEKALDTLRLLRLFTKARYRRLSNVDGRFAVNCLRCCLVCKLRALID